MTKLNFKVKYKLGDRVKLVLGGDELIVIGYEYRLGYDQVRYLCINNNSDIIYTYDIQIEGVGKNINIGFNYDN